MQNTRKVTLQTGETVTFTQRGKQPVNGFVRINGKTVTGFVAGSGYFFPYYGNRNALAILSVKR